MQTGISISLQISMLIWSFKFSFWLPSTLCKHSCTDKSRTFIRHWYRYKTFKFTFYVCQSTKYKIHDMDEASNLILASPVWGALVLGSGLLRQFWHWLCLGTWQRGIYSKYWCKQRCRSSAIALLPKPAGYTWVVKADSHAWVSSRPAQTAWGPVSKLKMNEMPVLLMGTYGKEPGDHLSVSSGSVKWDVWDV